MRKYNTKKVRLKKEQFDKAKLCYSCRSVVVQFDMDNNKLRAINAELSSEIKRLKIELGVIDE